MGWGSGEGREEERRQEGCLVKCHSTNVQAEKQIGRGPAWECPGHVACHRINTTCHSDSMRCLQAWVAGMRACVEAARAAGTKMVEGLSTMREAARLWVVPTPVSHSLHTVRMKTRI